jgi:phosphatidylserine/phosphatidylglycerophosphate/cardiolipin synthase-like enzyme
MTYVLTNQNIVSELCQALDRGVKVYIIADRNQLDRTDSMKRAIEVLIRKGARARLMQGRQWTKHPEWDRGHFHHKCGIADARALGIGSFNLSRTAEEVSFDSVGMHLDEGDVHYMMRVFKEYWREADKIDQSDDGSIMTSNLPELSTTTEQGRLDSLVDRMIQRFEERRGDPINET